jgi:hypothetical protein
MPKSSKNVKATSFGTQGRSHPRQEPYTLSSSLAFPSSSSSLPPPLSCMVHQDPDFLAAGATPSHHYHTIAAGTRMNQCEDLFLWDGTTLPEVYHPQQSSFTGMEILAEHESQSRTYIAGHTSYQLSQHTPFSVVTAANHNYIPETPSILSVCWPTPPPAQPQPHQLPQPISQQSAGQSQGLGTRTNRSLRKQVRAIQVSVLFFIN